MVINAINKNKINNNNNNNLLLLIVVLVKYNKNLIRMDNINHKI